MKQAGEKITLDEAFAIAVKLQEEGAIKQKPVATVSYYFEVLHQLDRAKEDLRMFGAKYGATRFGGAFDLRRVCKAYAEQPKLRAAINEIVGVV